MESQIIFYMMEEMCMYAQAIEILLFLYHY